MSSDKPSECFTPPQSSYEPLTQEDINAMAKCLLNQHELYPLTPGRIKSLCAMAGNALLYAEEIERLRTVSESTRLDLPAIIGPNTEMVQEISALVGKYGNLEGAETNCDVVSSVLNAAKRYLGGERE